MGCKKLNTNFLKVTIANNEHNGNIKYVYDATTGVKLKKIISTGTADANIGLGVGVKYGFSFSTAKIKR